MRFISAILIYFFTFNLTAQIKFEKNYFRLPVNIDFKISSNFGEIRPNHFHAGLDISTDTKSGINYYSAAEGYISRILVSPRGLGNAIYITHPNGYVTVMPT
jgi:murein DD-endopeptidase MepM/ murein hydrolase activator NlpD